MSILEKISMTPPFEQSPFPEAQTELVERFQLCWQSTCVSLLNFRVENLFDNIIYCSPDKCFSNQSASDKCTSHISQL